MIVIQELNYHLGKRTLYDRASLHIKQKDKIGLIGLNGTGKTTLLKLIMNEITPDSGTISKSKECSIGFLNQDLLSYQSNESIRNVAMQAFENILKMQCNIDQILHQMGENYTEDLLNKLAELQEAFQQMGGYEIQSKTDAMLEGMGFSTKDLDQAISTFSGGWRMRVMFAKLLLQQPSLLMLDEPTNHLDLVSIKWVESYLKNYNGAFIVVSHDRSFLDNVITKTVEVANKQLNVYAGNYSFYEKDKTIRMELQEHAYSNQQKKIKQTEQFIDRFRAKATKAKAVQSRIKALDRMEKVETVVTHKKTIKFNFSIKQNPDKIIISLKHIDKAFGNLEILKDAAIQIDRRDKIALIGANGRGKSTLLRIIAGHEPVKNENKQLGTNVSMAFYAQHQLESLRLEYTIFEELQQAGGSERTEQELRTLAGMFLFTKDDVFKKIEVLSGGEKARVALAKVLLSQANCLLLDEPTNHLDIHSIDMLAQALQQYQGTCLFVSHDRNFITQVATKIWYIDNKKVKEFSGTYTEFESLKQW